MRKLIQFFKNIFNTSDKQKLKSEIKEESELIADINEVKERLISVESRYNITMDEDLLESLIFEENALKARYEYLIKVAKMKGIKSEIKLNV